MTNLEWLYEHDEYFNSFAKLMACLRGFSTDEFTANEWLRQEHYEPNPDCSAMLYKMFTENMKHEPCSHYEPNPEGDALGWLRKWIAGHDPQLRGHGLAGLETIADVIERDYVRRESIEEVMDNDRALVDENSMLARDLLKLRAELEKATNNLNSANKDFENARAELTAERDNLKDELIDERGELNRQINTIRDVIRDLRNERDNYRSKFGKCLDYADAIHALMDDEGPA